MANDEVVNKLQLDAVSNKLDKLPDFLREDPKSWFVKVEALFSLYNITNEDKKFMYLTALAPSEVMPYISAMHDEKLPAGQNKYDTLKERVIQSLSKSDDARIRDLFKGQSLSDQKPSQFLVKIKNIAPVKVNETILKSLFLEQLPGNVRAMLSTCKSENLENLALLADQIMENITPAYAINAVQPKNSNENSNSVTQKDFQELKNELHAEIAQLSDKINKLMAPSSDRNRSRSRARSNVKREYLPNYNKSYCFAHNKYKAEARSCKPPCSWNNDNPEN